MKQAQTSQRVGETLWDRLHPDLGSTQTIHFDAAGRNKVRVGQIGNPKLLRLSSEVLQCDRLVSSKFSLMVRPQTFSENGV